MNKYELNAKKMLISVLLLIIVIFSFFTGVVAHAEHTNFEKSNVYNDLKESEKDGFSFRDYPLGSIYKPGIMNFVEYCYSPFTNKQGNYGLYVYFYNPHNIDFEEKSLQNTIQIATEIDENNAPTNYKEYPLQFCNKSEEGEYYNRFYKFKILNAKDFLKSQNSDERKYAVSGIELLEKGKQLPDDYLVGGIYTFSGLAEGYGANPNAPSSLKCKMYPLETLEIREIGTASYTFDNVSPSGGHDQLFSLYFSVPDDILKEYGKLQKIKFSYDEYTTSPILVTKNRNLYEAALAARSGRDTSANFEIFTNAKITTSNPVPPYGDQITEYSHVYGVNRLKKREIGGANIYRYHNLINHLPYVFYKSNLGEDKIDISGNEVLQYIYDYNSSNFEGNLYNRNITKDLFIGSEFKSEPTIKTIDADETVNLSQLTIENGLAKFWYKLFGDAPTELHKIQPIVKIENINDLSNIYIEEFDKDPLKTAYNSAEAQNRSLHYFTFANRKYTATPVRGHIGDESNDIIDRNSYLAKTTAFLNLDLIEFTFLKDGKYHMIPIVASPVDMVGNLGAFIPDNSFPWALILLIILLILLLPVIIYLLPLLFKLLIYIVSAPFKAIKAITGKKKNKANSSNTLHIVTHDSNVGDKKKKKRGQTSYKGERIYKLDNASAAQQVQEKPPKAKKSKSPKVKAPKTKKLKERKSKGKQDKPG